MDGQSLLCLDFDGVIHSYTSKWERADIIPDPPVAGAMVFMREAMNHFEVAVYSSRSADPDGLRAMQGWLVDQALKFDPGNYTWVYKVKWPTSKPPAKVTIDDRAITFTGAWPVMADLIDFQPWNRSNGVGARRVLINVDAPRYMVLERHYIDALNVLQEARVGLALSAEVFETERIARIDAVIGDALANYPLKLVDDKIELL
jgi:hypothetical protein